MVVDSYGYKQNKNDFYVMAQLKFGRNETYKLFGNLSVIVPIVTCSGKTGNKS